MKISELSRATGVDVETIRVVYPFAEPCFAAQVRQDIATPAQATTTPS